MGGKQEATESDSVICVVALGARRAAAGHPAGPGQSVCILGTVEPQRVLGRTQKQSDSGFRKMSLDGRGG